MDRKQTICETEVVEKRKKCPEDIGNKKLLEKGK